MFQVVYDPPSVITSVTEAVVNRYFGYWNSVEDFYLGSSRGAVQEPVLEVSLGKGSTVLPATAIRFAVKNVKFGKLVIKSQDGQVVYTQKIAAGESQAFTPRQVTNPGLIILEIDDKAWLSMNKPALHIVTELVLIVLTSLVFASFKPRLANILLLLLFNVCWILDFIYFYFSNEFINLNFSFMGIVIYKYVRQMETVFGALGKMKKKTDT